MSFAYSMDPSPIDILRAGGGGNSTIVEGEPQRDKESPRPPRQDTADGVLNTTSYVVGSGDNVTLGGGGASEGRPTHWGATLSFQKDDTNTIVVSILTGLIVVLCVILVALLTPFVRRTLRRRQAGDKKRIKKRYQTIDAWLITKPIIAHTDKCHSHSSGEPSSENVTEDMNAGGDNDEARECMICMEEFHVGIAVSWSPREENCRHVYHKECIREWLLRHKDCPYCRQVMLPIDGTERRVAIPQLRVLAEERAKRFETTNYCLEHGLVMKEHDGTKVKNKVGLSTRSIREDSLDEVEEKDEEMGDLFQASKADVSRELMVDRADDEEIALDEPPIPCLDDDDLLDELDDESFQEEIFASVDDILISSDTEHDNVPLSSSPV